MMNIKPLIICLPFIVLACGQVGKVYSDTEIQEICLDRKRAAEGPRGEAELKTGTRGTSVGLSVSVSDTYIRGLNPDAVYAQCVQKFNDQNARTQKQAG